MPYCSCNNWAGSDPSCEIHGDPTREVQPRKSKDTVALVMGYGPEVTCQNCKGPYEVELGRGEKKIRLCKPCVVGAALDLVSKGT